MKKAKIAYLRNHLSEVVSCVKEGETVLILDRDRPVAEIQPYRYTGAGESSEPLVDLQRKGLVTLAEPTAKRTPPDPETPASPLSIVDTVLQGRSEGW